jgi:predicted negative regulator of RcsB-dependent stress response
VARLRLAALDVDSKALDRALKTLEASVPRAFEPLVADRRGDVFMEQGKPEEAKSQYLTAWRGLTDQVEYRRLVEIKLAALGVDVTAQATAAEAAK